MSRGGWIQKDMTLLTRDSAPLTPRMLGEEASAVAPTGGRDLPPSLQDSHASHRAALCGCSSALGLGAPPLRSPSGVPASPRGHPGPGSGAPSAPTSLTSLPRCG